MKNLKWMSLMAIVGTMMCLVATSCNNKENDPKHPIQNVLFYSDYERGASFVRESFYFGEGNNFEYAFHFYANEARTQLYGGSVESGTYDLYDDYILLHYTKMVSIDENGKSSVESGFQPRSEKIGYILKDNVLTLTYNYGTDNTYTRTFWKD